MSKKNKNKLDKNFADEQEIDFSSEVVADKLDDDDQLFNAKEAEEKIQTLQKELKKAQEKAEQQWEVALRAKAEAENSRRRALVDVEKAHKYGAEKLLKELLAVYDSLEQGLSNIPEDEMANNSLRDGVNLTLKMLLNVLNKHGVTLVNPQDEKFNPEYHEAMSLQEATEDKTSGAVMQVMQKGFQLNGRLLRPARVIVAK